jgi:hypothetical protein
MTEEKQDFKARFETERNEWKEKIEVLALHMKDIKTLAKAQVDLFSQRQVLLEYGFKLASIVSKLNTKFRQEKAQRLKHYSENHDVRYGSNEKNVLIESDLAQILEKIELVEGHRKFVDQTIQTVDHMLYGIKSRIALEEYLRGGAIK